MALQSSGAISLANVQTEFGGSNPISITEYYNGGSYVKGGNASIPSSGVVSMSNFYGTQSLQTGGMTNILNTTSTSSRDITTSMGTRDAWTWIVVIKTQFSSDGLPSYATPRVNGSNMTTIQTQTNGYADDGHRVGAWYIKAPASGSITFEPVDGYRCSVFKITGVETFASNFSKGFWNDYVLSPSHSISGTSGNSSVIGYATCNFSDGGGIVGVTNDDANYGVASGASAHNVIWWDNVMSSSTVNYAISSTRNVVQFGLVRITYDI